MTASDNLAVPAASIDYPPARKAWWIVFVLVMASVAAGLDREILGLTVDPVRADLGITDFQISLLQGLSFSLFYATAGLLCGYVSDRVSRKWLLTGGLLVWTLATIGGGLSHSFAVMFAMRMLTGMGEATLIPTVVSTIADLFPPARRGVPIGLYLVGQSIGGGVSVLLSGVILTAAMHGGFAGIPILQSLAGWRIVFVLSGGVGVLIVFLMLTIAEAPRRATQTGPAKYTAGESFAFLRRNGKMFVPLYLGYAVASITLYGLSAWLPAFFTRAYGLTPAHVGAILGAGILVGGPIATIFGGVFIDRAARRGGPARKLWIIVILTLALVPTGLGVFFPFPVLGAWIISFTRMSFPVLTIAFLSVIQDVAPSPMRGLAVSICGLTNAVIAATGGPMLIALSTENIFHDPKMVGYGIATVVVPTLLAASILFHLTGRALKADLRRKGELSRIMAEQSVAA
jgi:MFS family permease